LEAEDFALLDHGQSQEITSVRAIRGDVPSARVHGILVLDAMNNNAKNLGIERKGVERFLEQNQGRLPFPVSLAALSSSGMHLGQPSMDAGALIVELKGLDSSLHVTDCADSNNFYVDSPNLVALPGTVSSARTDNRAGDCLNSSFEVSVSSLSRLARSEADVPGRLILVWIGPGWPRLTGSQFKPDTQARKRNFFDYLVELSTALREAQITVDEVSSPELTRVGEGQIDFEKGSFQGVLSEDQASAASMSLAIFARQSGGRILDEDRNLPSHIAACFADGELYYSLSFNSGNGSTATDLHTLQVQVKRPGVTARTYTGYYSQP
jgi:VWFA-related protein